MNDPINFVTIRFTSAIQVWSHLDSVFRIVSKEIQDEDITTNYRHLHPSSTHFMKIWGSIWLIKIDENRTLQKQWFISPSLTVRVMQSGVIL